jgi:hypothetical protein
LYSRHVEVTLSGKPNQCSKSLEYRRMLEGRVAAHISNRV